MGRSQTINVIGFSEKENIDKDSYRRYECHAMNKMEMAQKKKYMEEHGTPVKFWIAQTKTGCKMIGAEYTWEEIQDSNIKHVKLITCPICNGEGKRLNKNGGIYDKYCVVCNGSGLTKPNHWNKWRQWQIDNFKLEFAS